MGSLGGLGSIESILTRVGLIAALILATWLAITLIRASIDRRRARALAAPPFTPATPATPASADGQGVVRILAFSSDDCAQCHRLQTPALARVTALRGERVEVVDVDAPTSPELTERYAVLTLPTTVVLAPDGRAHAINYGFANSERLLRQCDEILASRNLTTSPGETERAMSQGERLSSTQAS
jgi:Thioredoxin